MQQHLDVSSTPTHGVKKGPPPGQLCRDFGGLTHRASSQWKAPAGPPHTERSIGMCTITVDTRDRKPIYEQLCDNIKQLV